MLSVRVAAIPVPLRVTELGEEGALLTMERLPDTVPTAVGRKATVIVVCCPAFTLKGSESPVTVKAAEPVSVPRVIVKVAVAAYLMMSGRDDLTSTTSFPKLIGLGL